MRRSQAMTVAPLFLVLLLFLGACAKAGPVRVVFIALDGISVEGLQAAGTPNIDALMTSGSFSLRTRVVMPSVTLPNWTSHLTGSGPEQHGVTDNDWRFDAHVLPPVETDGQGYYPSIFKVLKDQVPGLRTAFYYNWENLIYPHNRAALDEVRFQEDEGYVENYERAFEFIRENAAKPLFLFLYTVHTDENGHAHGWMSPEYIRSIEEADVQIGALLAKMRDAGLYEGTHFIFASDHGGTGTGHGGVTPVEMEVPWSLTGPGIPRGEIAAPNDTVNSAPVIARLFRCRVPAGWTGKVIPSLFGK
ncbi:MAG TPA: alkaline phosphatase family protein [Candidatus Aminicenantes bacterium]|mgnify:CR=1 FL=1|nr:alkaline phosphatase family protein [Candidatus Aminicenantes bacterium]